MTIKGHSVRTLKEHVDRINVVFGAVMPGAGTGERVAEGEEVAEGRGRVMIETEGDGVLGHSRTSQLLRSLML